MTRKRENVEGRNVEKDGKKEGKMKGRNVENTVGRRENFGMEEGVKRRKREGDGGWKEEVICRETSQERLEEKGWRQIVIGRERNEKYQKEE